MDIILKDDIANLGQKDDIVSVKPGYARNFLVPKGKATVATASAKKMHAENIRQRAHKEAKLKDAALKVAEQLENKKIKIGAKTSTTGTIFGSVNTIQLAEAIAKKGIEVDRKNITIPGDAIKEVGEYKATVKLHKEVIIEVDFTVVSE